jgi:hypothetical protein
LTQCFVDRTAKEFSPLVICQQWHLPIATESQFVKITRTVIMFHGLSVSLIVHIETLYLLPSDTTDLPVLFSELGMD